MAGLPAEGRAFIVIVRDSRKLDSQRPRPAGWMGGRLQGSYHLFCHPSFPHLCRLLFFPHRRGSQRRCVRRAPGAASRTCRQAAAFPGG